LLKPGSMKMFALCSSHHAQTNQHQDEEANDTNFRYGSLANGEIADWITSSDTNQSREDKQKPVGRIRMIICERALYDPIDFPMTKGLFSKLEKEFCLHPATLTTFRSHSGTFSRHLTFCEKDRSKLKRIGERASNRTTSIQDSTFHSNCP
jgi:hypothetical protein